MSETPIVLIIYNRPDLTARVFEAIRTAQPRALLVHADGPRRSEDEARCKAARAVIQVDWPCELHTVFRDENLGCGVAMWQAMDAGFAHFERAMMLEDDTLPHPDYFRLVDELLERYAAAKQVWCVSGAKSSREPMAPGADSYYFTHQVWTCSLATWRDRWQHYDFYVKSWGESDLPRQRLQARLAGEELALWINAMDDAYARAPQPRYGTFDYQFQYLVKQFGYGIVTSHNMITNLGFREDGTNATDPRSPVANLPAYGMTWPLAHPPLPEPLDLGVPEP